MYANRMTYGTRRRGGYGPVLNVSDCVNETASNPYGTFSGASPTGFNAASNGTGNQFASTADEISLVTSETFRVTFDLVLNSGDAPNVAVFGTTIIGAALSNIEVAVNGSNTMDLISTVTSIGVIGFWNSNSSAGDFEITNLSVRQAL